MPGRETALDLRSELLHVLGYYETGSVPTINESARHAGPLGQAVLEHERVHQELTHGSSHGVFLLVLNDLFRRKELAPGEDFRFKQRLQMLLSCSRTCQEGYATWVQLDSVRLHFGLDEVRASYERLPPFYQQSYAIFDWLAGRFTGLRNGHSATSAFFQTFVLVAMGTPIQRQFRDRPPEYGELKAWLDQPAHDPDRRLGAICERLAGDAARDELLRIVELVFAKYTAWEEDDGKRHWSLDEGFDIAITDAVFEWISRTLPVDLNPYTQPFQQQATELLETYRAVSGVRKQQSVPAVGLQNYGTHRFRFDGPGRDVEVQVAADAAALCSWAANSVAEAPAGGHRLIGGWTLGVEDAWIVEAARLTIAGDGAGLVVGIDAGMRIDRLSGAEVRQVFGASDRVLLIAALTLDTASEAALAVVLSTPCPIFVFVEKTSVDAIELTARKLGGLAEVQAFASPPAPVALIGRVRDRAGVSVLAFVHETVAEQLIADLRELTGATWCPDAVAPETLAALAVATRTNLSRLIDSLERAAPRRRET